MRQNIKYCENCNQDTKFTDDIVEICTICGENNNDTAIKLQDDYDDEYFSDIIEH